MTSRNSAFRAEREPFRNNDELQLQDGQTSGAFSFLNPTNAEFKHTALSNKSTVIGEPASSDDGQNEKNGNTEEPSNYSASDVKFLWRSRDNRKGRHAMRVKPTPKGQQAKYKTPEPTNTAKHVLKTIKRMFTFFPYYNISWLIAFTFTMGSIVWVINSFFSWLPLVRPSSEFHNEVLYAGGITAFIGAVIFFETGSFLLLFEAINQGHDGCFGFAVEELLEHHKGGDGQMTISTHMGRCTHHHRNKGNLVGKHAPDTDEAALKDNSGTYKWRWFPSWKDVRTHYLHEIGFLAGLSQFIGASIFSIAGITALPWILERMTPIQEDWAFWAPQIWGSIGFIVSGSLYMLETQKNWYTPNIKSLGWWIGFWNFIGALGFELCGALGPASDNTGAAYQSSLAVSSLMISFEI